MSESRIKHLEDALATQLEVNTTLTEKIAETRQFVRLGFEILATQAQIYGIDWDELAREVYVTP
jgi:uncharacterized coiled-coil protein SlyX